MTDRLRACFLQWTVFRYEAVCLKAHLAAVLDAEPKAWVSKAPLEKCPTHPKTETNGRVDLLHGLLGLTESQYEEPASLLWEVGRTPQDVEHPFVEVSVADWRLSPESGSTQNGSH